MIYLDNSSTTKQDDLVTKSMLNAMEEDFGNPSSLHELGRNAHNRIENARKKVAEKLGFEVGEVYFTSGGTEGNNTILTQAMESRKRQRKKLVTTEVEHPAVIEVCKKLETTGYEVHYLNVNRKCEIDLEELKQAVDDNTSLVSVMRVNNESGSIFPIREIARIAHEKGALVHTDGVQALGKVDLLSIDADFITVSAHKIHGPKGMGALAMRKKYTLKPFILGGGQERNFRSGTENVPGIVGMGEACRLITKGDEDYVRTLRDYLKQGLEENISDIMLNSSEDGVASILNISFLGTRGEVILHTLESMGIFVSTGSACSSNKNGQSHVLKAMGLSSKEIEGAIRFSLSKYNTKEEMDIVIDSVKTSVNRFRKLGSYR